MFYVKYVSDTEPKIRSFSNKASAMRFVANFLLKHQFETDVYWIDSVIFGKLIYVDPSMKVVKSV